MAENQASAEKKPLICVEGLRKVYILGDERVVALNRVDLTIHEGEICCIHGTSGSGKSTLLNLLAGLERPSRGKVRIGRHIVSDMNEKQLARFRQKYIGFIFQSYNLMDSMTAVENVALPLSFRGTPRSVRERIAASALRQVGLGERLTHKPTQMSGGQQQRVGIARAFVTRPRIVFADEPTGNLDTKTTVEVMRLMVKLALRHNQTLVIVSHDSEISDYADRVIHIVDGAVQRDYINEHPQDRELIVEELRVEAQEKAAKKQAAALPDQKTASAPKEPVSRKKWKGRTKTPPPTALVEETDAPEPAPGPASGPVPGHASVSPPAEDGTAGQNL